MTANPDNTEHQGEGVQTRLEEIRQRAEKATEGPWYAETVEAMRGGNVMKIAKVRSETVGLTQYPNVPKVIIQNESWYVFPDEADLAFIAQARSDVPFLLTLVSALQEENGLLSDALQDMTYQFAYSTSKDGAAALWTGGMSALEGAFEVLGWSDPHPTPESTCDEPGCDKWATCGTPTPNGGYRRTCFQHRPKTEGDTKP